MLECLILAFLTCKLQTRLKRRRFEPARAAGTADALSLVENGSKCDRRSPPRASMTAKIYRTHLQLILRLMFKFGVHSTKAE
ncbi:hypothetical protein M407DRAFT_101715 [Tulasnella calospora MUT 4182]|uniref:Uncharacterized protein n=1 Tax=Tulasnella calospora MUT 4182 TaxID=1051891 RepID=A0A0C3KSG9_9AGAM|nr:hypothetical protein M407DRAFT_101715 [Tulasnella calospora MUT 4182]